MSSNERLSTVRTTRICGFDHDTRGPRHGREEKTRHLPSTRFLRPFGDTARGPLHNQLHSETHLRPTFQVTELSKDKHANTFSYFVPFIANNVEATMLEVHCTNKLLRLRRSWWTGEQKHNCWFPYLQRD